MSTLKTVLTKFSSILSWGVGILAALYFLLLVIYETPSGILGHPLSASLGLLFSLVIAVGAIYSGIKLWRLPITT